MDETELQIKQDETTINDNAEKLRIVSNTHFVTKHQLLQQLFAKEILKTKMLNVAGKMFIQDEKSLNESNRIIRRFKKDIGDDAVKNDVLNKFLDNNIKEYVNSEGDETYKTNSINGFIKFLNDNKSEIQLD